LISRKGRGLSRPNLYLDAAHLGRVTGDGRFEVQLERLAQIVESLLFASALTGNIHVQALRNKPITLAPNRYREGTLHTTILPYLSRIIHARL
jgi:hypothetical protein